jgi:Rrf2 family transcriptional regulator, iron-sulfur cluster assembly transcription factor
VILSASATHALRAVAWIAANARGEAVPRRELARRVGVPADYLAKVMGRLQRAGVVTATRGVSGGYRLARAPRRIRVVEVIEPFEGSRARPGCLLWPTRPCRDSRACSAHGAWGVVKTVYARFLEETTLADIQGGA